MSAIVTLYKFKGDGISVSITAGFENGDLIVEGYDIGKVVEECWGDSDYEYSITVEKENVVLLTRALGIHTQNEREILQAIAGRFNGNKCFSELGDFLSENNIEYKGFSWT